MKFLSRRSVMYSHLNPGGILFGGQALAWIDEEAAMFAACQAGTTNLVTVKMSTVEFRSPGHLGDILEIGTELISSGRTSITVSCEMRNKTTGRVIVRVDEIVFVALDENNQPFAHKLSGDSA